MSEQTSVRIVTYGRVQGVFFRAFAAQRARELGLTGYARNLSSGDAVEIVAEGERNKLEKLIDQVKVGPPAASVENIEVHWSSPTGKYHDFTIRY